MDAENKGFISWPQFKAWWEERGNRYQLSVERQQALNQAAAYFQVRQGYVLGQNLGTE
eukprot:m.217559 g.217559  ORF g.217559 m.217559 type:complete len:58 (+) comp22237_c4_seq9:133-306(+)